MPLAFLSRQLVAFIAVGGLAATANFLSQQILTPAVGFPLAVSLAYLIGLSTAFVLNRWLVFPHSRRPIKRQMVGFLATNLAFLPLVLLTAMLLRDGLARLGVTQYTQEMAHLMAIALPTVFSYLIYKFRVFGESTQ